MIRLALSMCIALPLCATADTIVVPIGTQGDASIQTPNRGVAMSAVVRQFGQPKAISKGVGDPPITTWQYDDFNVYFEYDKVIHSVKNPSPTAD